MHAPATVDHLLQNEDGPSLNALVEAALQSNLAEEAFGGEQSIAYGPVVMRPEKIVCVGLNYRRHAKVNLPIPQQPVLFSKFNNSLSAHKQDVKLPVEVAHKFDYETELVIVMGKNAKNVSGSDAISHVAGYFIGNDLSARFAVRQGRAMVRWQDAGSVCSVGSLSGYCRSSRSGQLEDRMPILGYPKDKQVWLKAGDKIACSVEKLGELRFGLVGLESRKSLDLSRALYWKVMATILHYYLTIYALRVKYAPALSMPLQ
jgi:2-keto-4-pentenoate hydratase/2-oxohepta-3-ene-1,7-dioic acid hydratase in catechol pathway